MPETGDERQGRVEPLLVLWDIDRTLVSVGAGVSRAKWALAFQRAAGRAPTRYPHFSGRTDKHLVAEVLRLNDLGSATSPETVYAALAEVNEEFAERMRADGRVMAGAREAVAALAAGGVVQTVVTGNLRAIARTKLATFDLTDHLDLSVGGYGEESADRADLVRAARERAGVAHGFDFSGARSVVIGDTPHDVQGAHDAGALAVAVATGVFSAADLTAAAADLVLPDLTHLPVSWRAFLAAKGLWPSTAV